MTSPRPPPPPFKQWEMAKKGELLPVLGSIEKKSLKFAGSPDRKLYRISDLKKKKISKTLHDSPCRKTPRNSKFHRYIGSSR
jgi:hypothetical protein